LDEFMDLSKKAFIYECQNNPHIIYEYRLDKLNIKKPEDRRLLPEVMVESDDFQQHVHKEYIT